jgi:hypothetical protein
MFMGGYQAMATIKLALDPETYTALMAEAARYLRPADWHAKAILRQALGLQFPYPPEPNGQASTPSQEYAA